MASNLAGLTLSRVEQRVWLTWLIANATGWFVGFALLDLVFLMPAGYEEPTIADALNPIVTLVILASLTTVPVAASQWLVLRRHLRRVGTWLGITVLGFNLATGLWWFVSSLRIRPLETLPPNVSIILFGAAIGIVVGFLQWLLLRQQSVWASLWLVANPIASIVACIILYWASMSSVSDNALITSPSITGLVFGATSSAITSIALVYVLRNPRFINQSYSNSI